MSEVIAILVCLTVSYKINQYIENRKKRKYFDTQFTNAMFKIVENENE